MLSVEEATAITAALVIAAVDDDAVVADEFTRLAEKVRLARRHRHR